MTNKKIYLILYYICFLITFVLQYFVVRYAENSIFASDIDLSLASSIAFILFIIIVTVLFVKIDIKKSSILVPIIYLAFLFLVCSLIVIYFGDLVLPFYRLYYFKIILFGYLFLNIYTFLCLTKKGKVVKEK